MKIIYFTLKATIVFAAISLLYFASYFWIGTKNDWDEAINNRLLEFFISRLAFTLAIGMFFWLISALLDWWFRKVIPNNRKKRVMELIAIVVLSIIFVSIAIMK